MGEVKSLCVRLNLAKKDDKTVWDILRTLDKKKWKSVNRTVITAVKDFFERNSRLDSDPYFETREREEKFTADIISAVERSMDKEIPKFLSICFGEIIRQYGEIGGRDPAPAPITAAEKKDVSENTLSANNDYSDFDIDFMGE